MILTERRRSDIGRCLTDSGARMAVLAVLVVLAVLRMVVVLK